MLIQQTSAANPLTGIETSKSTRPVRPRGEDESGGAATGPYGQVRLGPGPPPWAVARGRVSQDLIEQSRRLLEEYYQTDPEAKAAVERGEIPDYWGVQQTGQRIFDLLVSAFGSDGASAEDFVKTAKALLDAAYSDVEQLLGSLPGLVTDTRDALYAALDNVAGGMSLAEARESIGA